MTELRKWIKGVFWHWRVLLSGGAIALFQFAYSLWDRSSSPVITWLILLTCLLAAMFLAWQEEHRKAEKLEERLAPRLKVTVDRRFQFQKRSQLFIGVHNETFSVAQMYIHDPNCSSRRIQS